MPFCRDPLGIGLGRRLRPLLGVALLLGSQAVSVSLAASIPFFSGISSIEVRPGKLANVQILEFQADQPFEYKMSVIDADHVALKLYNAQLANNLLTPEGGINLMPGGAIQSATLRLPDRDHLFNSDYQEIILTGKNLARQKLQILGATPQVDTVASQSPSSFMKTDIVGLPTKVNGATGRNVGRKPTVNLPDTLQSATGVSDGLSGSVTQRTQVLASASNLSSNEPGITESGVSRGPRIESMQTLPERLSSNPPSLQLSSRETASIGSLPTVTSPQAPSGYPIPPQNAPWQEHSSENTDNGLAKAASEDSEDGTHMLMPALPHYRGGAKPIAAVMTDRNGNPIHLKPKAQPLPEFSIGPANGGYTTLYQAETAPVSPTQLVSQRMAEALTAFRGGRYPQAQQSVESALSVDPDNATLYAALAEIQLKRQQFDAARNAYQKAVELAPAQYRPRYVQILVLSGDRQSAIDVLTQQYQENPRQAQLAYMLGTLHEELGQSVSALPYLQQAAKLQPQSADVQYNLGLAYELTGARTQARQHYQTALKLNPKASDIAKALQRIQR